MTSFIRKTIGSIIILLLLIGSLLVTRCSFRILAFRGYRFFEFLSKMFPIDQTYLPSVIGPIIATLQMSVAGTAAGAFLAIFTSFLCARNITKNKIVTTVVRLLVQIIRTIPVLILALISTFILGIGTFAGTAALTIYTWAVMTRIGSEDLEAMDISAFQALIMAGCPRPRAFMRTVFVEMVAGYLNNSLYLLETNVRHASILGYVGAGGIGLLLNEKISWREYAKVGTILILLYVTVLVIELCSSLLRNYLQGKFRHSTLANVLLIGATVTILLFSAFSVGKPQITTLGMHVVGKMLMGILHPDLQYLLSISTDGVPYLLLETLCIAIAGTFLGAIIAFVLSLLNSRRLFPVVIALPVRLFIMAIRTIPVFVYGLMFIRVTGPGSFAGVMTLSLCSIGLISKRFTVVIDQMDFAAWNAYRAMGISWLKCVRYCFLPKIWPQFVAIVLYRLDVNIRSASVLGLVGAGGIGAPLILYMNNYRWDAVGAILIGLYILVLTLELLSAWIRKNNQWD